MSMFRVHAARPLGLEPTNRCTLPSSRFWTGGFEGVALSGRLSVLGLEEDGQSGGEPVRRAPESTRE